LNGGTGLRWGIAAAMEKVASRLQKRTAAQAPWGVPSDIE
jgi:hypothetical protein